MYENTDIIMMEELKYLNMPKAGKALDQITYHWNHLNLEETIYKCTY
jgi:hypothetical protein